MRQMQERSIKPEYDKRLHAYECKHCGRFHVGHANPVLAVKLGMLSEVSKLEDDDEEGDDEEGDDDVFE